MSYTEIDTELLLLAARGGDRNQIEAKRRIREMPREERHCLRLALQRLDDWLDDIVIEERLSKIRPAKGAGL